MELQVEYAALLRDAGENARAAEQAQRVIDDAETLGWSSGLPAAHNILARLALAEGNTERAQARLRAAFAAMQAAPDAPTAIALLETGAQLANGRGDFGRAAQLTSAAQAQRETMGIPRAPVERAQSESQRDALRARLGAENFARVWAEGRALTMPQARALAQEMLTRQ